jgi:hypothetical protein
MNNNDYENQDNNDNQEISDDYEWKLLLK